jgi:hypothetical protein
MLLGSCGGSDGPSTPIAPTPSPPTGLVPGAALSFVSGEDGTPVAGAQVVVAGRSYSADAGGRVTLAEPAAIGAFVDVVAAGFFDRQTQVRSDLSMRYVLWPRRSPTGIDDDGYTATIVYTSGTLTPPTPGSSPLLRLPRGTTQVTVVPSTQILGDDHALPRLQGAIDALNDALAGAVRYQISTTRPSAGVVFDSQIDPADSFCNQNPLVAAYTSSVLNANQIMGGRMVFCKLDWARSTLVVHELGHTFGLQHSPLGDDVMVGRNREWADRYSAREELIMRLMLERPAGNRFPDTDRSVPAGANGMITITCP